MECTIKLDIKESTFLDILQGKSNLNAAIIRDVANGTIVEHVPIVPGSAKQSENSNVAAAVAATAVIAVVVGGVVYLIAKHCQKRKAIKIAKKADLIRTRFAIYLEKARNGELDIETVDNLIKMLDEAKGDDELLQIALGTDQLLELAQALATFTQQLVMARTGEDTTEVQPQYEVVYLNIRHYLKTQSDVLRDRAA